MLNTTGLTTARAWSVPGDYVPQFTALLDNPPFPAMATLQINVLTNTAPQIQLHLVPGLAAGAHTLVMTFAGAPGLTCTIESAPSLSGPRTMAGNVSAAPVDQGLGPGVFEFTAPMSTNSVRFYRTVYPAY